jgi:hypothetical protein
MRSACAAVALHRVQGGARQAVAHQRRQPERQEVGDRQLGEQLAQRLVALVEPHGADGDRGGAGPGHRRGQDAQVPPARREEVAAPGLQRGVGGATGLGRIDQRPPAGHRGARRQHSAGGVQQLALAALVAQ